MEEIYTPLAEIETELKRRRADGALKKAVDDFFGEHALPGLQGGPHAFLSRPIINPNREFRYFLDLVEVFNIEPKGLEYHDKFVAKNWDKYHLGKMFFFRKIQSPIPIFHGKNVLNFNKHEGKNFRDIETLSGKPMIEFYHDLLFREYPDMKGKIIDITEWFQKTRLLSKFYYLYFLSLFIYNGVLFENYMFKDKEEASFFNEKIWPSFQEACRIFGVRPLIYPLLPIESERNKMWVSYESSLHSHVEDKLQNEIIK